MTYTRALTAALLLGLGVTHSFGCARRPAMELTDHSALPQPSSTQVAAPPPPPATVADAVKYALNDLHELDKNALRAMRRSELPTIMHGFQMSARYAFGLNDGSNVALLRSCGSETMPLESCLLVILEATWVALQPPEQL